MECDKCHKTTASYAIQNNKNWVVLSIGFKMLNLCPACALSVFESYILTVKDNFKADFDPDKLSFAKRAVCEKCEGTGRDQREMFGGRNVKGEFCDCFNLMGGKNE